MAEPPKAGEAVHGSIVGGVWDDTARLSVGAVILVNLMMLEIPSGGGGLGLVVGYCKVRTSVGEVCHCVTVFGGGPQLGCWSVARVRCAVGSRPPGVPGPVALGGRLPWSSGGLLIG